MSNIITKKKLLLVDDDEVQLSLAVNILKGEYEVVSANSGKTDLEFLYKGYVPDLIILDLLLPNMDGWEIFKRIKAIGILNDVPVAFLTALDGTTEKNQAQEIGAADFIVKPFNQEDLLKRIAAIIAKNEK